MTRLPDLTSEQIRMLVRLDDGQPHEDSVGKLEEQMTVGEFMWTGQLVRLGLAERRDGWNGQVWYRLTEEGRRIRDG